MTVLPLLFLVNIIIRRSFVKRNVAARCVFGIQTETRTATSSVMCRARVPEVVCKGSCTCTFLTIRIRARAAATFQYI